jgi:hypothetical protein
MQGFSAENKQIMKQFNANMRLRPDFLPPVRDPVVVKEQLKSEMMRLKEKAGVGKKHKDGSLLFLLVCGALRRIRAGEI